MTTNEVLTASGTALAAAIRDGALSSRAVTECCIAQIERINPKLNAMVQARFATARREADLADGNPGAGHENPWHGVPCSIKESFALTGMPNSAGLRARSHVVCGRDAVAVARLRGDGAIPLGVTNVPELCMWMETGNKVYGTTNNPYDLRRTPGGSSGGEAALIAAGGAPFGLGSDIGGSIRMPAFFCGLFGHKPSAGLIPNTGHFPVSQGDIDLYNTTGPLSRHAEDLWPLLTTLATPQVLHDRLGGTSDDITVADLDVYVVEQLGDHTPTPPLIEARQRAAKTLAQAGARLHPYRLTETMREAVEIWSAMLAEGEGASFAEQLGSGTPLPVARELFKLLFGASDHTFPAVVLALLERLPRARKRHTARLVEAGIALRRRVADDLGEHGILLLPTHPKPAPRHHAALLRPFDWIYTGLLNVLHMPATQIPMGLTPQGLPVGVQAAAAPDCDHVTIAVAQHLAAAHGGWQPSPFHASEH